MQAQNNSTTRLPNGWGLSPVGTSLPLGDLPLNIAVSRSGKWLAVTNNGQSTQSIQLVDAANHKILSTIIIPKSWLGLQFSSDERFLYASGGNDNRIMQYKIVQNELLASDSFYLGKAWPKKISPAGLTIDNAAGKLYVVTKENNSLYTIDLASRKLDSLGLGAEAYTCVLSADKKELYIALWGGDKILVYNTIAKRLTDSIAVGDNPNDICLDKKGKILYVANANDNSVSVIEIKKREVVETLNAALYPESPTGSTTNGLALSADEKTLYIANADNNCLTVFDVSKPGSSSSKGFIPVGWYPTCVKVIGKKIFVTNGKGFTSLANPQGPNPYGNKLAFQQGDTSAAPGSQYIGGFLKVL